MIEARERERLARRFGDRVAFDVPLRDYTSWRVGGPADIFYRPRALDDLLEAARELAPRYPFHILGHGTNTLFADGGYRGAIFCLRDAFREVGLEAERGGEFLVRAGAGARLEDLHRFALQRELAGMEWAYGVPGSIGGALRMNAGTFLGKAGDCVLEVRGIDGELRPVTWRRAEIAFEYRKTSFPPQAFFADALFRLARGQSAAMAERLAPLKARKDLQPLAAATAGSTFKNPAGGSAAALIDGCGLKGLRRGGAVVSQQHANFIINEGGASAADILELIREVRRRVEQQKGVRLEPEVILVGVEL